MTGQIFPIKEICALARERGITSIVDGAHAFAHVPFQFSDVDCDFYGSSLHKWLSAPIGTGMLYVRKDRIEKHWALMAAPPSMDKNIRKYEEIGTHPAAMHNATLASAGVPRANRRREEIRAPQVLEAIAGPNGLGKVPGAQMLVGLDSDQSGAFGTIHFETMDPGKLGDALLSKYNIFVTPISSPGLQRHSSKPQCVHLDRGDRSVLRCRGSNRLSRLRPARGTSHMHGKPFSDS